MQSTKLSRSWFQVSNSAGVMLYAGLDLSRSNTVSTSMFYSQGRAGFGEESGDISTYWFLINRK